MAGAAQHGGIRRAWGAPAHPKPGAEQRRDLEAATPATVVLHPPAPAAAAPHATQRPPPSKHTLPRLSAAGGAQRTGQTQLDIGVARQQPRKGLAQQQVEGPHRLKQQLLAVQTAAAAQSAGTIPAQHGAAWKGETAQSPPLLPSASPQALPGAELMGEDDDRVLIGSTAPSFTAAALMQQQQLLQQLHHAGAGQPIPSAARQTTKQAAEAAPAPQLSLRSSHASPHHSRRGSQASPQLLLGADDMSLTMLAQASHLVTHHSSIGADSLASSRGSSGHGELQEQPSGASSTRKPAAFIPELRPSGKEATLLPQAIYAIDATLEPQQAAHPATVGQQPQQAHHQPARRLSTGELAVLRQSLLELQLVPSAAAGNAASGSGAAADEVPDAVVLQALSSKLSRFDSQKRRVLLAVLAKIDGLDGGTLAGGSSSHSATSEDEGAAGAAASQLIAESLPSSRRQTLGEAGSSAANVAAPIGKPLAGAQLGLPASAANRQPINEQPAAPASQTGRVVEQQQQQQQAAGHTDGEHQHSTGLAGKLDALRLARGNILAAKQAAGGGSDRSSPGPSQAPAARQPSPLPQQQNQQPQPPFPQVHSKLQPLVQHRHPRSRPSADGARVPRASQQHASHLSPAVSAAGILDAANDGDALAAFATEHHAQQAPLSPPAAVYPSVDASPPHTSLGDAGNSFESSVQPPQGEVSAGGALSARGQLVRTSTLPVLQGGASMRQQAHKAEAAGAGLLDRRATSSLPPSGRGSTAGGAVNGRSASAAALLHCHELILVVLDTWGDSHFVGLAGLQLLGADAQVLPLSADQLAADPPDLNCFPGHTGDVRTIEKLADGTNNTMDDGHMWLAPVKRQLSTSAAAAASQHRSGAGASWAVLPEAVQPYNLLAVRLPPGGAALSGLRVWNYNKSPQDTSRGVKRMLVLADGVEVSPPGGVLVRRAPGTAGFPFGQTIPLSTCWVVAAASGRTSSSAARPPRRTSLHAGSRAAGPQQQQQQPGLGLQNESVAWVCNHPDPAVALDYLHRAALLAKAAAPGGGLLSQPGENFATVLPCGFALRLVLLSSWGCPHYMGLSGLEIHDAVRGPLRIRGDQVYAEPASVAQLPGMGGDARTPDKLVDGDNSGTAAHSWLAPLDPQQSNSLHVTLDTPLLLSALRVWNYAKTPDRGVQQLEVYLDEHLVWKGLLQRAPADLTPGQDFSQTLCFSEEALAEAAATSRRRAGACGSFSARRLGRSTAGASLAGDALGAEGVEEWCQAQDRVILVNEGQFVAFPPDAATEARPVPRPGTSVVAAA